MLYRPRGSAYNAQPKMVRMPTIPFLACRLAVAALACAGLGGCVDTTGLAGHTPAGPGASVPPAERWKAYGSMPGVERTIDGQFSTHATSDEGSATLTIDFGKPATFNLASLDHGSQPFGFADRLAMFTSIDGQTFTRVKEVTGTRQVTYVVVFHPVVARYVKFQVLRAGPRPWTVAEVGFH